MIVKRKAPPKKEPGEGTKATRQREIVLRERRGAGQRLKCDSETPHIHYSD